MNDFTITTLLHLQHNQHKQKPLMQPFNYQYLTSIKTLTPHITCLAVHRNLLYAASLNLINVFDLSSNYTLIDTFNETSTSGFVKSITFTGSRVFTAHQDCKIRIWHITSSKQHCLVSSLPTVKDRLRRCIVPKNYVTVRRHRKSLWIKHNDTVSGLAVNEKEKLMYSVSWDKSFKIWDLSSGYYRCLESFHAHDDAINAVVVSEDGTVYTASADGCIKAWKMDNKVKRYSFVSVGKQKPTVNALAMNGDGRVLFSGGSDGTICRWESNNKKCEENNNVVLMETLRGHSGAILCLVNVNELLVSGSADHTVRIWRRERRDGGYCCRGVLEGHEKPVKSLVVTSGIGEADDGVVKLFSGSLDGEIRVWECLV
ncbi:protein JINGUBANG-like [Vicia villosa]|uniref:protein JINGUBANG-like n=1 Tax=Vicia villosa TaxID=3911 RepID=UPI00273BB374|nr:protein JINGUBANG-like [Vicia villosa]